MILLFTSNDRSFWQTALFDVWQLLYNPQEDDEEIDPDVRELGDYFNIEERWAAGSDRQTCMEQCVENMLFLLLLILFHLSRI